MTQSKKQGWAARKRHDVTLPSGAEVTIQIPNLPLLAKTGRLPNNLVEAAVKMGQTSRITADDLAEQEELTNVLVAITVVDPELEPDDVRDLPYEDVEMIVEFALRVRDMDAVYHHIGGLERVDTFRDARAL